MILIFEEEGTVYIAEDVVAVLRQCEGVDVDAGVYRFYDDAGRALKPVFDAPVKETTLFWRVSSVSSGRYHLEPESASESDPLWLLLHEAISLQPNPDFDSLEHVKAYLRQRGAVVDYPGEAADPPL